MGPLALQIVLAGRPQVGGAIGREPSPGVGMISGKPAGCLESRDRGKSSKDLILSQPMEGMIPLSL